jgi:hypothetical protein
MSAESTKKSLPASQVWPHAAGEGRQRAAPVGVAGAGPGRTVLEHFVRAIRPSFSQMNVSSTRLVISRENSGLAEPGIVARPTARSPVIGFRQARFIQERLPEVFE